VCALQVPVVLNDAETLAAQAKLDALKKGFGEESLKAKAAVAAETGGAPSAAPAPTLKGSSANKVRPVVSKWSCLSTGTPLLGYPAGRVDTPASPRHPPSRGGSRA
jgi:hypothetical protein